jgi:hypothetical protein
MVSTYLLSALRYIVQIVRLGRQKNGEDLFCQLSISGMRTDVKRPRLMMVLIKRGLTGATGAPNGPG